LATTLAYWPALRSGLEVDDFFMITIARMIGSPWVPFTHNHFTFHLYYRPLTMAFWWLTVDLFGADALAHYLCNLALHIGVCLALWHIVFAWTRRRTAAFIAALAFAVHPATIGTTLWLADRFDLFATLFSLLAIHVAWRYRQACRRRDAVLATLLALAATLSKEIGLAALAPIAVLWLWPQQNIEGRFTPIRRWLGLLILCEIALVLWRTVVLGNWVPNLLTQDTPLWRVLLDGPAKWMESLPTFFTSAAWMSPVLKIICLPAAGVMLATVVIAIMHTLMRWRQDESGMLILSAFGLLCASVVLQAPTLHGGIWLPDSSQVYRAPVFDMRFSILRSRHWPCCPPYR
jgi:hypothetical protein